MPTRSKRARKAGHTTARKGAAGHGKASAKRTPARRNRDLVRAYSRAQFVAKLRRFADAIERGRPFTIQVAGERLNVPAEATFNIEHERAGARDELEFQLIWTRDR